VEVNIFVLLATHVAVFGGGFLLGSRIMRDRIQKRLEQIHEELSQRVE
jgi:hypothetical protein